MKESMKRTKDKARKLLDAAKKATNTNASEELSPELKNVCMRFMYQYELSVTCVKTSCFSCNTYVQSVFLSIHVIM